MAVVYRALDTKLDRMVTLKVMRESLGENFEEAFVERFYKEAQSIASLSHANIVKVYDYGEDNGINYIVMEYVEGKTLKDLITKRAPFDEDSLLGVSVQIASGLLHAHKNEVIHRDIKPQNILVTTDGSVKIADFGIARATKAATLTNSANSMGSVHYFSPEQARGGFVDHKSDIYALGITMFEMATGKLPFDGEAAVAIALKHLNDPFPDPQEINPNISDRLSHIIRKATEKSSSKRYSVVEDMYRDMKRAIHNVDVLDSINLEDSPTTRITQADLEEIRKSSKSEHTKIANDEKTNVERNEINEKYNAERAERIEAFKNDFADYDDEEETEPLNKKVLIAALSTAAVLVLLITMASFLVYNNLRNIPTLINPPNIVGLTIAEAELLLAAYEINLLPVGEEYSEEHPEGTIAMQGITPSETLAAGDSMPIVISLGSEFFPMPDIIRVELDEAIRYLQALGLETQILENEFDIELIVNLDVNIVLQTEPAPEMPVSRGQTVVLHTNPTNIPSAEPMPNLRGMQETVMSGGAEISILDFIEEELGLALGVVLHEPNAFYAAGTVSFQSIEPGTLVVPGTVLNITFSTGTGAAPIATPTATPTPVATPEPTPQPTPVPIPVPTPTPQLATANLQINLWPVPEDVTSVHLRVYGRSEYGEVSQVFDSSVSIVNFPIPLPVTGSGTMQFLIYSVEEDAMIMRGIEDINFNPQ